MARKTRVLLLCDLHGNSPVEAEETLFFAVGRWAFEIDVCATHGQEFRSKLQPYLQLARRHSATGSLRRVRRRVADRRRAAEIRAWAKERGYQLSERGRIPVSVVAEYENNH